ncbi:hypothetical protein C8R45DRAFT_927087 [Mycena sanguinolenta]|nr:hypothetical protein C8R45DRAFT_927087 [Mycena sanguinolenta]
MAEHYELNDGLDRQDGKIARDRSSRDERGAQLSSMGSQTSLWEYWGIVQIKKIHRFEGIALFWSRGGNTCVENEGVKALKLQGWTGYRGLGISAKCRRCEDGGLGRALNFDGLLEEKHVRSMMRESATGAAATESVTVNEISSDQSVLAREDSSRQDTTKAMRIRNCMTMKCDEKASEAGKSALGEDNREQATARIGTLAWKMSHDMSWYPNQAEISELGRHAFETNSEMERPRGIWA